MILPGVRELIKPQWVAIIEVLKADGGMAVPELAAAIGMSYMGTKQHCLKLVACGYLECWRVPRTRIGRPELMYRLTPKADELFPQVGAEVTLALLEAAGRMFGETAPERIMHRYLQQQRDAWWPRLQRLKSLVERATKLAELRGRGGCLNRCCYDAEGGFRIEEFHHPLQPVFQRWPGTRGIELRMLEEMLGTKVTRRETAGGRGGPARVVFEIPTLGRK
jgi:predicted ArsR family transcriptional regulator